MGDSSSDEESIAPVAVRDTIYSGTTKMLPAGTKKGLKGNVSIPSTQRKGASTGGGKQIKTSVNADDSKDEANGKKKSKNNTPVEYDLSKPLDTEDSQLEMTDIYGDSMGSGENIYSSPVAAVNPAFGRKQPPMSTPSPSTKQSSYYASSSNKFASSSLPEDQVYIQNIHEKLFHLSTKADIRVGVMKLSNQMETVRYVFVPRSKLLDENFNFGAVFDALNMKIPNLIFRASMNGDVTTWNYTKPNQSDNEKKKSTPEGAMENSSPGEKGRKSFLKERKKLGPH